MSKAPHDARTEIGVRPRPRAQQIIDDALHGPELPVGARVGQYEIEARIAQGGFATIYKARSASLGRVAALKVLHKALCGSRDMIRRFQREAEAVNVIRHPNIVDIFEIGELSDGRPFLLMEWLDGLDVDQELRAHGPFSAQETLALMEDLAAALVAAHSVGVVHRDLKASNVVLTRISGWYHVTLVDFGIAKLLGDTRAERDLTTTGCRLGTPSTMAPEQILGLAVDARTDLYALGLLLYQLLTGSLPFSADTSEALEQLHLRAQPPRLAGIAGLPAAVDDVIQRCLQKRPEQRFAGVEEMMRALRAALTQPPRRETTSAAEASLLTAIGLHVEARLETAADIDDDVLDDLAGVMTTARRALAAAGLPCHLDTANTLFTALPLPPGADAARATRRYVVDAAAALLQTLLARPERQSSVTVALSAHVGNMVVKGEGDAARAVGGDLLCFGDWVTGNPDDAVTLTAAALHDLGDATRVEPLHALDGRFRLSLDR